MSNLKPNLVADLANSIYALTHQPTVQKAIDALNARYTNLLSYSEKDLLKAKTGGPLFIKCQTAFGFTLIGQGALKGHAFIIFRGTQFLADWLTNLNISPSRSLSGQPVHDGFNQTFNTMRPKIMDFINEVNDRKISHIHCIGHSLGGAIATLCAEWISVAYKRRPFLYTFGSPRVGLYGFASNCTQKIGAERIFRVYHQTDIVPFIPVWPYLHTPLNAKDYYIPSPGLIPLDTYHYMNTYVASVTEKGSGKSKTWKQLSVIRAEQKSESALLAWLKQNSFISLNLTTLEWLNQALLYVLDKCMKGLSKVISYSIGTTLTLMDQLAYLLEKGIDLSTEVSDLVLFLMRKFLTLIGYANVVVAADLTQDFIRLVLQTMQTKVNQMVKSALSQALVKGQAI